MPFARILVPCLLLSFAAGCSKGAGAPGANRVSGAKVAREGGPADAGAHAAAAPLPEGDLRSRRTAFQFAVYALKGKPGDGVKVARQLARKHAPGVALVQASPEPGKGPLAALRVVSEDLARYAPPSPDYLESFGRGLDAAQVEQLQRTPAVTVMTFYTDGERRLATLRAAHALAHAVAVQTGGLVWDEETREVFSPAAWRAQRIDTWKQGALPPAPRQVVLHYYRDDAGKGRIVSLGMVKLGLPDVVVEDVPGTFSRELGALVNATCQALVEKPVVGAGGTLDVALDAVADADTRTYLRGFVRGEPPARARVVLVEGTRQEGDPRNRLAEVSFAHVPARSLGERQYAVLRDLFGSAEEPLQRAQAGDPELEAARARVRARLPTLRQEFARRVDLREHLSVKAPFTTSDGEGTEYMWVDVETWDARGKLQGVLDNEPYDVPGLKQGARVEVEEATIFDYMLRRADGGVEGGETQEILERRARQRR